MPNTTTNMTGNRPLLRFSLLCLLASSASSPVASEVKFDEAEKIPHVGNKAKEGFQDYLFADGHKAFAIAPGGAWAWVSDHETREKAQQMAILQCARHTQQKCIHYAIDDEVVFDQQQWSQLWGPYKTAEEAPSLAGTSIGRRFPNLALTTASGKKQSLNDFQGRVVILHFWGSWCPPCCRELPDLQSLSDELAQAGAAVDIVMVPVRERYDTAVQWLKQQQINLPVYDAGAHDEEGGHLLNVSNGETIPDRAVARVFPATYVLDKSGVIVFSRQGPIKKWKEYTPFLLDAAENSGK